MELCEGGELLDRILSRGGRYPEEDAKTIVIQILSVVAFCHLQGVVHHDLKPENFLFTTRDEDAPMKVIDFGLSDYIRPVYTRVQFTRALAGDADTRVQFTRALAARVLRGKMDLPPLPFEFSPSPPSKLFSRSRRKLKTNMEEEPSEHS